ncbi:uncharacterized protein N7459_004863 [Penicillium hispanicum]|uniref:uncharacterized protein n=1 Tax=Penicillium hispanicum TaxID=1080232 RepID=UPI00253F8CB9|nr:uncharacterized protein N7459_004863 [Penicillium hispanicum]KAJ5585063.1 hypothetical protein N7459_004863 [Penicillium hispanicum]
MELEFAMAPENNICSIEHQISTPTNLCLQQGKQKATVKNRITPKISEYSPNTISAWKTNAEHTVAAEGKVKFNKSSKQGKESKAKTEKRAVKKRKAERKPDASLNKRLRRKER